MALQTWTAGGRGPRHWCPCCLLPHCPPRCPGVDPGHRALRHCRGPIRPSLRYEAAQGLQCCPTTRSGPAACPAVRSACPLAAAPPAAAPPHPGTVTGTGSDADHCPHLHLHHCCHPQPVVPGEETQSEPAQWPAAPAPTAALSGHASELRSPHAPAPPSAAAPLWTRGRRRRPHHYCRCRCHYPRPRRRWAPGRLEGQAPALCLGGAAPPSSPGWTEAATLDPPPPPPPHSRPPGHSPSGTSAAD